MIFLTNTDCHIRIPTAASIFLLVYFIRDRNHEINFIGVITSKLITNSLTSKLIISGDIESKNIVSDKSTYLHQVLYLLQPMDQNIVSDVLYAP